MYRLASLHARNVRNKYTINHLTDFTFIDIYHIFNELSTNNKIPVICKDIVSEIVSYIHASDTSPYYFKQQCYISPDTSQIEFEIFHQSTNISHKLHIFIDKPNCDPYMLFQRRLYLKRFQTSNCFFYGDPNNCTFLIKEIFTSNAGKTGLTLLYFCLWNSRKKQITIRGGFRNNSPINDHIIVHSADCKQMICIQPNKFMSYQYSQYFVCHHDLSVYNIDHLMQQTIKNILSKIFSLIKPILYYNEYSVKQHTHFMLYHGER
eukprot:416146_1